MLPLRQPLELELTRVRICQNDKPYRSKKAKDKTTHGTSRVNKLYSTGRGYCPLLGAYRTKLLTLELLENQMKREPHSKYTFAITEFKLEAKWNDGEIEDLTLFLPESLLNEIEQYLTDMDDLRTQDNEAYWESTP